MTLVDIPTIESMPEMDTQQWVSHLTQHNLERLGFTSLRANVNLVISSLLGVCRGSSFLGISFFSPGLNELEIEVYDSARCAPDMSSSSMRLIHSLGGVIGYKVSDHARTIWVRINKEDYL